MKLLAVVFDLLARDVWRGRADAQARACTHSASASLPLCAVTVAVLLAFDCHSEMH